MAVFKIFRLSLDLFQVNGPKNEMLFWLKSLFLKGIIKTMCDLVVYVFLDETEFTDLHRIVKSSFNV